MDNEPGAVEKGACIQPGTFEEKIIHIIRGFNHGPWNNEMPGLPVVEARGGRGSDKKLERFAERAV